MTMALSAMCNLQSHGHRLRIDGVQSTWQGALHSLASSIQQLQQNVCATAAPSGSIRLEVEFPATFTALEWLLAQSPARPLEPSTVHHTPECAANGAVLRAAQQALQVYFSPRHSPQPAADSVTSPTVGGVLLSVTLLWQKV
jgi:hypothetical protein